MLDNIDIHLKILEKQIIDFSDRELFVFGVIIVKQNIPNIRCFDRKYDYFLSKIAESILIDVIDFISLKRKHSKTLFKQHSRKVAVLLPDIDEYEETEVIYAFHGCLPLIHLLDFLKEKENKLHLIKVAAASLEMVCQFIGGQTEVSFEDKNYEMQLNMNPLVFQEIAFQKRVLDEIKKAKIEQMTSPGLLNFVNIFELANKMSLVGLH